MIANPKPVQKPHPPVIVGGAYPYAARRAVQYGDGWYALTGTKYGNEFKLIPKFKEMLANAGRDRSSCQITICLYLRSSTLLRPIRSVHWRVTGRSVLRDALSVSTPTSGKPSCRFSIAGRRIRMAPELHLELPTTEGCAMNKSFQSSPTRRHLLRLAATGAALAVASPALRAQTQPHEAGKAAAVSADDTTFEDVWRTVRDRSYDPHFHGLDWAAVRERYRSVAAQATSKERQAAVINSMLLELHASHTHYYMQDEPEFYQLAGIFTGALRRQGLQRIFPDGHISYPGIGILSRMDTEARGVVLGVIDGTPARQAGLLPGDEIVTIDGAPFRPVQSFRGK